MKRRNPIAVLFLPILTFGIYGLVWYVKTKNEMNRLGAGIPTAWLMVIPLANFYWFWVYSTGVKLVTKGEHSTLGNFLLLLLLGPIGMAITQNEFNKVAAVASPLQTAVPA